MQCHSCLIGKQVCLKAPMTCLRVHPQWMAGNTLTESLRFSWTLMALITDRLRDRCLAQSSSDG